MKERWVYTKMVLTVGFGLLFIVLTGKFCQSRYSSKQEKSLFAPSIKTDNTDIRIKRMKVTAYYPGPECCGKFADGKTSTGKNAWKTFGVAADPKILPYGTKLEIPEIGIRIVDDTGGAMRKSGKKGICHIDVRMHSYQEAKKFGIKWLNVKILN